MDQPTVSRIEARFRQLPISEQLSLIERLVHRVHERTSKEDQVSDNQLALMAADPQIQSELRQSMNETERF